MADYGHVLERTDIYDDVPQSLCIFYRLRTKQNSWIGEGSDCVAHNVVVERTLLLGRKSLSGKGAVFDTNNDAAAVGDVSKSKNILDEEVAIPAYCALELKRICLLCPC